MVRVLRWWLLFAGPVYQAALELGDERQHGPDMQALAAKIEKPEHIAPWWWLLPPVGYVLQKRRSRGYREAFLAAMSTEELRITVGYAHKANGWVFVAVGAVLIATKESYELAEHHHWPIWVFVVLVVVMVVLAASYTAVRMAAGRGMPGEENHRPARRAH